MKIFGEKAVRVVVVFMVVIAGGLTKESQGFPCGRTFFSALIQLIPCRPSVAPFAPIPPAEGCCSAIKALGQSCLCMLVTGPPISGIDRNMAMQLPDKCAANFEPC